MPSSADSTIAAIARSASSARRRAGDLGGQLGRALLHAALEVLVQQRALERRAGLVAERLERAQLLVGEQLLVGADELQDAEDVLAGAQLDAEVGLGRRS